MDGKQQHREKERERSQLNSCVQLNCKSPLLVIDQLRDRFSSLTLFELTKHIYKRLTEDFTASPPHVEMANKQKERKLI